MEDKKTSSLSLQLDLRDFFKEKVSEAIIKRKAEFKPLVESYLVDLLSFYSITENLYDDIDNSGKKQRAMLAELLLQATQSKEATKIEILKKLGDSSLYVSGFFSASLNRKIVDVDYYVDMGTTAFGMLSNEVKENTFTMLYGDISAKFLMLVDVLTYISDRSFVSRDQDILRLMDLYSKTGLPSAGETLVEKGIFNIGQIASGSRERH